MFLIKEINQKTVLVLSIVLLTILGSCTTPGLDDDSDNSGTTSFLEPIILVPKTVYISEVITHPTNSEQIKIKNNSFCVRDISSWTLGDENDQDAYSIPENTLLEIGEEIIFTRTTLGFQINNRGETLYLKNDTGNLIHTWKDKSFLNFGFSVYFHHVIAHPTDSEAITLVNNNHYSVDLSNWTLGDLNNPFAYNIPVNTILEVDESITFYHTTLGFGINNSGEKLYLYNTAGTLINTWSN